MDASSGDARRVRASRASWVRHRGRIMALGVALVVLGGCTDAVDTRDPREALLATVTPELAAQVDTDGQFIMPDIADTTPHLGRDEARALAVWASGTFAPQLRGYINQTAGRTVDLSNLTVCGQVWAEPPNDVVPVTVLPYAHWLWGPWWIVTFCRGRTPALAVAVAAYATHLSMKDGEIVVAAPTFGPRGDEILLRGLPTDWQGGVSVTPETAAILLAQQGHQLVDRVPRLIAPCQPIGLPFDAKWAVHLDQPITVRSTDTWVTDELFVGNQSVTAYDGVTRSVAAASPVQPASVPIRIPAAPYDSVSPPPTTEYLLTARAGMTLVLEPVTVP